MTSKTMTSAFPLPLVTITIVLLLLLCSSLSLAQPVHDPAKRKDRVDPNQLLSFFVTLSPNDIEAAEKLVEQIYDPKHDNYHKFLKPAEFYTKFSPKPEQVQKVTDHLKANGIEVTKIEDNQMLLHVKASTARVESFFNVNMHTYVDDQDGSTFMAPDVEPTVPSGATAVIGLDTSVKLSHSNQFEKEGQTKRHLTNSVPFNGGPEYIRTPYDIPSTLYDGSSQTIAVVEFDNFLDVDIATYSDYFNLPPANMERIYVDNGCSNICKSPLGIVPCGCSYNASRAPSNFYNQIGVTSEISSLHAVAPNAKMLVYVGANVGAGFSTYSKIAADNRASVVISSWGVAEYRIPPIVLTVFQFIFVQMALQGQAFFASTGAYGPVAGYPIRQLMVFHPAGQKYVTAVGSTSLTANPVTAQWEKETSLFTPYLAGGGCIFFIFYHS